MVATIRESKTFFTIKHVCGLLGLSNSAAIIDAIRDGSLSAVNVTATSRRNRKGETRKTDRSRPTWRIAPEALAAWLESRSAVPTTVARAKPKRRSKATSGGDVEYFPG